MNGLTITLSGDAAATLQRLRIGLADRKRLHSRIAGEAELFLKEYGRDTVARQHRSATTLGAMPTRHLERAYASIESVSNADAATLLIPRASRLRAAFGDYVILPGSGRKYLTIPVHRDAYGRRAGEFTNLVFVRVGPRQTAALSRKVPNGGLEIMYFLTRQAKIKQDRGLIPFDKLREEAADVALEFAATLIKK